MTIIESTEDRYGYDRSWRIALPQLTAVSVKNLLLFSYGMTLGFTTIVIPAVNNPDTDDLYLDANQISWFSSINLICVPLGCFISGVITDCLGRRSVMRLCTLPFIVAWLMYYFANSVTLLYVALIITGFTGGLLEAPVLTYVAEITLPYLRGMLSATSSMSVIIGIFTQFLFGLFFTWRTTALINIVAPVVSMIALFFVPESPYWLIAHERYQESKESLKWLRGWTEEESIIAEYVDIYKLIKKETEIPMNSDIIRKRKEFKETWKTFTNRSFLLPIFLVSLVFFLGHFCGMTTLQTYAVYIFDLLGSPIDKYQATLILGIVQILGALSCVTLVHFVGKRLLTFISTLGTAACCFIVGAYAYYVWKEPESTSNTNFGVLNATSPVDTLLEENNLSWIPMTFLISLAFLSHLGIRLLPWILIGEVFTTETRSIASGFSSGIGYVFSFLANKYFLTMISTMRLSGTYWFYGCVILIGSIIFYFLLPETEGKQLSEIEAHFSGKKKLTNKVAKISKKIEPIVIGNRKQHGNGNMAGIDNSTFKADSMNTLDSKL